jgi:ribosomal protein S18 acetylase RimI-like enzyme
VDVIIRPVRPHEHAEVGDLVADTYASLPGARHAPEYLAVLRDTARRAAGADVMVAVDADDRVVGSVTYAVAPSPWAPSSRPGEAEFRMLVVAPEAQGRGVGEALVRWAVDRARADGVRRMVLATMEWMTAAHRLYERLGFVRTPERDWSPAPAPDLRCLTYGLDVPGLDSPAVVVRPARDDAEELARVGEITFAAYDHDRPVRGEYAGELRDAAARAQDAVLLVAELGGQVVGTVTYVPDGGPWGEIARPGEAEFRMLAVDPTARGQGVGEALTRAVVDRARAEGKRRLVMSSRDDMHAAHRLYERLGFTRDPHRDWRPVPEVSLLAFGLDL